MAALLGENYGVVRRAIRASNSLSSTRLTASSTTSPGSSDSRRTELAVTVTTPSMDSVFCSGPKSFFVAEKRKRNLSPSQALATSDTYITRRVPK